MNAEELDHVRVLLLNRSNEYRAMHGVVNLTMDDKLNDYAQINAEKLLKIGKLVHDDDSKYGENLAMLYAPNYVQAVKMWYEEVDYYDYNSDTPNMKCLHFTQLVWKETILCGFGIAKNLKTRQTIIVALYEKPGNVLGFFKDNVFPAKF
uniref:SCP domain-containing protein n=1 Tax=Rhabditophanes sp. KR3021 TaxID=114890 RepID=A0AC35TJV7_9BILA